MSLKYLSQLAFLSTQGAGVVNVLIPTGIGIKHVIGCTVNSEIFARILFSRIALKDIFVTFKIHD